MHMPIVHPTTPPQVRRKEWRAEEVRAWPATELALGMFDRAERWAAHLPPMVYQQAQIESFASGVEFVKGFPI